MLLDDIFFLDAYSDVMAHGHCITLHCEMSSKGLLYESAYQDCLRFMKQLGG